MSSSLRVSRWWLVVAAAVIMGVAGTYQFAWSSIRLPLGARVGAPEAALGTIFTVFVVFQTLSQYPAGWVRDRFGPRIPLAVGAVLLTGGYAGVALASTFHGALLAYAVGGVGVGAVYTVAVNTPVKWFDEHRGLATGLVTMAYSGLSFLLIPAIRNGVAVNFRGTILGLAAFVGAMTLLGLPFLRDPDETVETEGPVPTDEGTAYTWRETVRTWQFWVLYFVFIVVNGVGLMLIGKIVTFATELGLPGTAATLAASLVALADAGGIVVVGGISDRFGRERVLGTSLVLGGLLLAGAVGAGSSDLALVFVGLAGAAAFFRSPAFSLMPTMVGEYYGATYSSENYALLYTAKLWGGVFGGTVASALVISLGWSETFLLGGVLLVVAGVATFALRPV